MRIANPTLRAKCEYCCRETIVIRAKSQLSFGNLHTIQVEDVSYISTASSDFLGPHSAYRTHLFASLHLVHNAADREAPEGQHGHVGAALDGRRVELHVEVGVGREALQEEEGEAGSVGWRLKKL